MAEERRCLFQEKVFPGGDDLLVQTLLKGIMRVMFQSVKLRLLKRLMRVMFHSVKMANTTSTTRTF